LTDKSNEAEFHVRENRLHLEVEVQKNDHFSITWLKERVLYVVVKNINFVTAD